MLGKKGGHKMKKDKRPSNQTGKFGRGLQGFIEFCRDQETKKFDDKRGGKL